MESLGEDMILFFKKPLLVFLAMQKNFHKNTVKRNKKSMFVKQKNLKKILSEKSSEFLLKFQFFVVYKSEKYFYCIILLYKNYFLFFQKIFFQDVDRILLSQFRERTFYSIFIKNTSKYSFLFLRNIPQRWRHIRSF